MNTKERIAVIQDNLAENDRLYRDGKRSKKLWATCKRDGKHRLTELRNSHRKQIAESLLADTKERIAQ